MIFFAPGTLVDPPLAPTVRGPGCTTQPKIRPVLGFGLLVHMAQILGLFGAFLGRFSDISWSRRALEGSLTQ